MNKFDSALKSDELTNYTLVDRENLNSKFELIRKNRLKID